MNLIAELAASSKIALALVVFAVLFALSAHGFHLPAFHFPLLQP